MISIQNILLPTDFSDHSLVAAEYAFELAKRFSATVHLLHVIEEPIATIPLLEVYGAPSKEEYEAAAQAMLDNWPLPDEAEHVDVVRRLHHGTPFVQIVHDARDHDIDLIVMGSHGRGMIAHVLLGNVAEKVVRKAGCPVLTIRPEGHQFVHPAE